jgi:hypothetical protein
LGGKLDFLIEEIFGKIRNKKIQVKSEGFLRNLKKCELSIILWLRGGFNELVSLSFEDFREGICFLIKEMFASKYEYLDK